jgi:hypothetical protein
VSALEARVQIREGLRELLADGASFERTVLVNLLLDRCGSDHRTLVDLLCFTARWCVPLGPPVSDEAAWRVQREAFVARLRDEACLEPDPARWAVEALHYADARIPREWLSPVAPFAAVALPVSLPQWRPRPAPALATRPRAHTAAGLLQPPPFSAVPLTSGVSGWSTRSAQMGSSLRFGQPWYAVHNGSATIALPSPSRGPRRPPPIAPISGPRFSAGWTRQRVAMGGALGAVMLSVAFSYWLMLNAARNDRDMRAIRQHVMRDSLRRERAFVVPLIDTSRVPSPASRVRGATR